MIHPLDTAPPRPFKTADFPRPFGAPPYLQEVLRGVGHHFEIVGPNMADLYIEADAYHFARAAVYYTMPAFVHVNIVPLEFTS